MATRVTTFRIRRVRARLDGAPMGEQPITFHVPEAGGTLIRPTMSDAGAAPTTVRTREGGRRASAGLVRPIASACAMMIYWRT